MPAEITREGLGIALGGTRKIVWRKVARPRDDFGRTFIVHLDRNNLHPAGQFERDFVEGFAVPDQYLSIPEGEPWRVKIDFERWAADVQAAHDDYARRLKATMQRLYGADAVDREPSKEAIAQAGSPPEPVELVLLYAHGDRWCLGAQPEPTEAVKRVLKNPALWRRYVEKKRPRRKGLDVRENGLSLPAGLARLMEKDRPVRKITDPGSAREQAWRDSIVDAEEGGEPGDDAINPEE